MASGDEEIPAKKARFIAAAGPSHAEGHRPGGALKKVFANFSDGDSTGSASPSRSPDFEESEVVPASMTTVKKIFSHCASDWNNIADDVFDALKVKTYILNPEFLLTRKFSQPTNMLPTIEYFLTSENTRFPSWSDIEDDLMKISPLYKGCENLTYVLRNSAKSQQILEKFSDNIRLYARDERWSNFNQFISSMDTLCSAFLSIKEGGKHPEYLFQHYLFILLTFMTRRIAFPVDIVTNYCLDLHMNFGKDCTMHIWPDVQLHLEKVIMVVAEVKRFANQPADFDFHKDVNEKSSTSIISSSHDGKDTPPEGEENTVKTCPDEQDVSSENSDSDCCGSVPEYFRKLDNKEKEHIKGYLPQLLAGMLAAMKKNQDHRPYQHSNPNERLQLGLSMNGFKVRFVRLVLRHTSENHRPIVDEIKDSRTRCDVYMTQEINLLKPRNIKMFFQIVYAIICAHSFR